MIETPRQTNEATNGNDTAARDPGRPEAMPLDDGASMPLTHSQRAARELIDRLVRGMAKSKEEEPRPPQLSFLPQIDRRRRSRVILIEGERGAGKTSLMLTLLEQWSKELDDANRGDGIVPVAIVELAPLPSSTSLLFLLASSLRPIVTELEREQLTDAQPQVDGVEDDTGVWLRHQRHEVRSRRAWRRFVETAATGWSRDMPQRQTQLDPEAFAIELEQAEDRRLQVVGKFRGFIDALAADLRQSSLLRVASPLFVVPIDDADMNPGMGVRLLELMRALHHPRLVFLLTGSSDLFRDTLRAKLTTLLTKPVFKYTGAAEREALVLRSFNLTQRIYDKSIPPSQRIRLDTLAPEERFERVKEGLGRVPFESGGIPGSAEFSPSTSPDRTLADVLALVPVLQMSLPPLIREAIDFRVELDRFVGAAAENDEANPRSTGSNVARRACVPRPIVEVVLSLWESATRFLDQAHPGAERITDAVRMRSTTKILEVEVDKIDLDAKLRYRRTYWARAAGGYDLERSTVDEWIGTIGGRRVPGEVLAAFLLASAVALEGPDDIQLSHADGWRNLGRFFMKTQFPSQAAGKLLEVGWPLFDTRLVLDVLLFARGWSALSEVGRSTGEEESIDFFARRFLGLALLIARDRWALAEPVPASAAAGGPASPLEQRLASDDSWEALADELHAQFALLADDAARGSLSDRGFYLHRWIVRRAGLIATPESGVPAESAGRFLAALKKSFKRKWREVFVPALESARCERLAVQLTGQDSRIRADLVAALIVRDEIDAKHRKHPWVAGRSAPSPRRDATARRSEARP